MKPDRLNGRYRQAPLHRDRGQQGLTLIEMLVAIALIGAAVVGIVGGIAATERSATINQDQANLETSMRQLSDFVRSPCRTSVDPSCTLGLLYQPCAMSSTYQSNVNSYLGSLQSAGTDAGLSWSVVTVNESTTATRTTVPQPQPLSSCGTVGGVAVSDYGVQEITLTASSANRSLTRIVWKADT